MPESNSLASTRAHDLFIRLSNLEYELTRLLHSAKDCETRSDDYSRGAVSDLINFLDERRRFTKEMQLRIINTAAPAIKTHYERLTEHTLESVEEISDQDS